MTSSAGASTLAVRRKINVALRRVDAPHITAHRSTEPGRLAPDPSRNEGRNMNRRADIQNWIAGYLAKELEVSQDQIPLDEQLTNLGITSRQAVMLTGDLEDYLGRPVDPAVIWDHPTIRELALHLEQAE